MIRIRLGQTMLIIAVIMILASGILTWLNLVDAKAIGGLLIIELILAGAGIFMSKKK
jgi:hypothetical protein